MTKFKNKFKNIKVDYSLESKANNYDTSIPGCYAIYIRKNIFSKWIQKQTYADIEWTKKDAYDLSMNKLPLYY